MVPNPRSPRPRCTGGSGAGPYSSAVADRDRDLAAFPPVPGGILATRRAVRRRGGVTAIGVAVGLWVVGLGVAWVIEGPVGGALSFVLLVLALPVMPVLGMPAAGGGMRLLVAIAGSGALWWFIGQIAAGRVSRHPVVGWREWTREFLAVGLGVWIGAAGGLLLGALALGAL